MRVSNIKALSPTVTPWKNGQYLHAGAWTAMDTVSEMDGAPVRTVKHYATEMVEMVDHYEIGAWWYGPLSTGRGSVSDQNGCNILAAELGSPLRMRRDAKGGGARFVNTVHGNTVTTRD